MIRPLLLEDIDALIEHVERHMSESGRGSTPIFAPYSAQDPWKGEGKRQLILDRWQKPLDIPGWERAWAAFDGDRMIGHLDLRARPLVASLHRAVIGMGIEESHRKMGIGQSLIETAVAWAKMQPSLEWADLNVFAHNLPAIRLYEKCGFIEVGRIHDLFRIDGQMIDDLQMVLRLR